MNKHTYFALILCLLLISSCAKPTWQQPIEEYAERILRIMKQGPVELNWRIEGVQYPPKAELIYKIPRSSIGLIDFLRLSKCDLQRLLGQKNSSLGKFQSASAELFYTVEFIRLAEACFAQDGVPGDIEATLEQALTSKKASLNRLKWNATMGSEEFQTLFGASSYERSKTHSELPAALQEAIYSVIAVHGSLGKEGPISDKTYQRYERSLGVIASSHYVGNLIDSHLKLSSVLNQLRQPLVQGWQSRKFCIRGSNGALLLSKTDRQALMHVFSKYYIGGVQKVAADLYRQWRLWEEVQSALLLAVGEQKRLTGYLVSQKVAVDRLRDELRWHTEFWKTVLESCDLAPSDVSG